MGWQALTKPLNIPIKRWKVKIVAKPIRCQKAILISPYLNLKFTLKSLFLTLLIKQSFVTRTNLIGCELPLIGGWGV